MPARANDPPRPYTLDIDPPAPAGIPPLVDNDPTKTLTPTKRAANVTLLGLGIALLIALVIAFVLLLAR